MQGQEDGSQRPQPLRPLNQDRAFVRVRWRFPDALLPRIDPAHHRQHGEVDLRKRGGYEQPDKLDDTATPFREASDKTSL
jgi:hypothetical protein